MDAWQETAEVGSNKLRFERGEILFGKIRPYFHKVSIAPFAGVCSADTFVISATHPSMRAFIACLVSSDEFVGHASATANGAKMPRANWDVMMEFPVAVPAPAILESFAVLVEPWLDDQQLLVSEAHNLRRTRDLLLPRLLIRPALRRGRRVTSNAYSEEALGRTSDPTFVIEEPSEGGWTAHALGPPIFTEADSMEELHEQVRDAVRCHFEEADRPKVIRLHSVREELIVV